MSSFPGPSGVYTASGGQRNSRARGTDEAYPHGLPFQDGYLYPVYGADGRPAYQPEAIVSPPTSQYPIMHQVPHDGSRFANSLDITFATQPPGGTMAPSVLHLPPTQVMSISDDPSRSSHMDPHPRMASTSVPSTSTGVWISHGAPDGVTSIRKTAGPMKKPRQQFSACTACRVRRVKCDLKDLRVEWEKYHGKGDTKSPPQHIGDSAAAAVVDRGKRRGRSHGKPNLAAISRKEDIRCTNCHNRGSKCMYVPISRRLKMNLTF